ncbi:hypothetical protein CROQUDRAFT_101977 [Cronartium quercuum f. sp. fusiforme G11]|uniref:Retrotransposon Copia-like N-terminal domain-containing protein n=1 Tax=Cronartium quercuum f. sp. fusiforme G11 TaxID=708437 RepID=A0A9P6N510_9BASI|nr:hypothetical protein CROQUDRAFT_101977 [Cronartium quercuum f. sp. fusiforme G11]
MATSSNPASLPQAQVLTSATQILILPTTLAMIPKLSSGNIQAWKMRLEACLGAYKLWGYILTDVNVPLDPVQLDEYTSKNCQALKTIHSTVNEANFELIAHLESAQEVYTSQCNQHGNSGGLLTAMIFYDLVNLRLQPGGSVVDHVHKLRQLHN